MCEYWRVLLISTALFWQTSCNRSTPMAAGDRFFGIAPDTVTTFDYETADFRLTAHRFVEQAPFRVTVETRRDAEFQQCAGDANFQQLLNEFETLKIRRQVYDEEVASLRKTRTYHRMRLASLPPMESYEALLTPLSNGFFLIEVLGFAYEISLSTKAADQLSRSCHVARSQG